VGPASFHFLREFDFPAHPGGLAGIEAEHHNDLAGLFNRPADFRGKPVVAAQVAGIAPDAQATGFQRHRQILGEGGIGPGVADEEGGSGHYEFLGGKGRLKR